jgi:hypothetical protein
MISSAADCGVSVPETSVDDVPEGLISRLSVSFGLGTGIREKPVNDDGRGRGSSFGVGGDEVVAFPVLFLSLMLSFLLRWLDACNVFS